MKIKYKIPAHIKWTNHNFDDRVPKIEYSKKVILCEFLEDFAKRPIITGRYNCQGEYVIDEN